jgi:hypothetical protein
MLLSCALQKQFGGCESSLKRPVLALLLLA